jgi:FKBP-type peptidyl-prolyl cis-trans isomerase
MKSLPVIFLGLLVLCEVEAFVLDHSNRNARLPISSLAASSSDNPNENTRRQALDRLVTFTGAAAASVLLAPSSASAASAEQEGAMYAPKFVQTYDDFQESPEGWSYREVTAGKGDAAAKGDRVVYDWVSYVATIYDTCRRVR